VAEFPLAPWVAATARRLSTAQATVESAAAPALAARTSPAVLEQIFHEALRYLAPHFGAGAKPLLEAAPAGADRVAVTLTVAGAELPAEAVEGFFEPFSGAKVGADPPLGLAGLTRPWQKLGGELILEADPGAPLRLTALMPAAEGVRPEAAAPLVLLVEDEPGIRSLVAKGMERDGWRVMECAAPAEALDRASSLPEGLGLLVTDLMVPGMPGGDLAAELRGRWPDLPVLFISGYTSDAVLADLVANSTLPERTRFLAKPFTIAALLEAIHALVPR
jgi:two-component system cell cycle sensor histidine kinase/response regulator CckA